MPGKIDAYNLGDLGVDLVSSPLHSADGTLVLGQNVIVETKAGQHAIAKRPGHTKLNTVAASGALLAICPIPFADPSNTWIEGSVVFRRVNADVEYSTDGATWTNVGSAIMGSAANFTSYLNAAGQGRSYFQNLDAAVNYLSGNPPARTTLAGIAITGQRGIHAAAADEIYVCVNSLIYLCPGDVTSELICADPWDGDGVPWRPFKFNGEVFVASITTGNSGKIYRYAGGTTWEEDGAFNVDLSFNTFALFHNELYACAYVSGTPDPGTSKIIRRRSGSWQSTLDAAGDFYALCAFNEALYVVKNTGAATQIWFSPDGDTWTLDEDMTVTFGCAAAEGRLVAWNQHLYCLIDGDSVFRRTTAGVWTEVDTTAPLGIVLGAY